MEEEISTIKGKSKIDGRSIAQTRTNQEFRNRIAEEWNKEYEEIKQEIVAEEEKWIELSIQEIYDNHTMIMHRRTETAIEEAKKISKRSYTTIEDKYENKREIELALLRALRVLYDIITDRLAAVMDKNKDKTSRDESYLRKA